MKRDLPYERVAYALACFAVSSAIAYCVHRTAEFARSGPQNPLAIIRDLHVGYYWRVFNASFFGGLGAWIGWHLAGNARRRAQLGSILFASALPTALVLVALSFLFP